MATHRARRSSAVTRLSRRVARATLATSVGAGALGAGLAQPASATETNVWDRVADCESSGNWSINTGNGYYGGLQFSSSTWLGFGGGSYAPYAHQATKLQQITIAQKVLKVQGPGAWPVCSVRAGLTVENGSLPYPGQDTTPTPAPAPSDPGTSGSWTVASTVGANVRSGPGTSYAVVGGLGYGAPVSGTLSNGWVKMAESRYVSAATLSSVGSSAPAPGASTMAPLVVDGSRGPLTVKAIQRWVGVTENGYWNSTTITALQRKVGTTPDGSWGPASQAALQTYLGISRDGSTYMNYRTVVALQQYLNANVIG